MNRGKRYRMLSALLFMLGTSALQAGPIFTGDTDGVAVSGYDVVAYFTEGEPVAGLAEYSYRWQDVEWRFASAEHRALFQEDPEKYAPAYGGHCAFGVASGRELASSPQHWVIHEGRLFLNLNENVHGDWMENLEENIATADSNWPEQVD